MLLVFSTSTCGSGETQRVDHTIISSNNIELQFSRYPAEGDYIIVWLAPGYGLHKRSYEVAKQLSAKGIEIWQIDLADALFLPRSTEQMRAFTGQYIADLIQAAHRETKKKVVLLTRSYGTIPLLRGIRMWQQRKPSESYVLGGILFSPDLYTTIPSLGDEPEYVPITSATNAPLMIFQDGIRGNRWYINKLIDTLRTGGSQPELSILPGVSALFFDADSAPATLKAISELPQNILASINTMALNPVPLKAVPMRKTFKPLGSGIDHRLRKFNGTFSPLAIDLKDSNGKRYQRKNYLGQITIINFWATWCPPCVEEIPSLNRLKDKMAGTPFELISVNYAQSKDTVKEFLKKVDVMFPVLLDGTGQESINWKVVAFPSTYIIGPDGKIHYGVNAAIQWDSEEIISALKRLSPTK